MVKEKLQFMIEIEKSLYSPADRMEMNINSTLYRNTLKEANKIAKEEASKGNKVEIWKLIRRY